MNDSENTTNVPLSDARLTAQVELWKTIHNTIENIRKSFSTTINLLIIILGAIMIFAKDNNIQSFVPKSTTEFTFVLIIVMPIGICALFAHLAYNFRYAAILEGYSAKIEEQINSYMGKVQSSDVYILNSKLTDSYVVQRNIANTGLLPLINALFTLALVAFFCVTFFIMDNSIVPLWGKILYTAFILTLYIVTWLPFLNNEKIRYECMKADKIDKQFHKLMDSVGVQKEKTHQNGNSFKKTN